MPGRTALNLAICTAALACAEVEPPPRQPPTTFTLLHTSDLHSRLWPFRTRVSRFEAELGLGEAMTVQELGGAARLATLIGHERQRGAALWLDSGDALEGAEVFHRYGGHLELELLSSLGLGAMAVGNHELSLTGGELAEVLSASARFPVLAANLRLQRDSPLRGAVSSDVVIDVQGMAVGIVGVANPGSPPNLASANNPWGLELLPELAVAIQSRVDDLSRRAELVIVLSHLGMAGDRALVRATTGIDLVLGGHQHLLTPEPEWQDDCLNLEVQERLGCSPRGVPIVHSGAYSKWLSRLTLELRGEASRPENLEVTSLKLTQLPVAASVLPDPGIEEFLDERRAPLAAPLGFLQDPLPRAAALGGDSPLGNLAVDAVLRETAADVALLNTSSIRGDLEAGLLLRSDLELAFPFDEPWWLVRLSGRELRRGLLRAASRSAVRDCVSSLQVSGIRLKIRCAACRAARADCLEVARLRGGDVTALDDSERVLVALPQYLGLTGGDFEGLDSSASETPAPLVTAVAHHLSSLPPGRPDRCFRRLREMSVSRCRAAFGAPSCPLDGARALAACQALPSLVGARDGRIEMLP